MAAQVMILPTASFAPAPCRLQEDVEDWNGPQWQDDGSVSLTSKGD